MSQGGKSGVEILVHVSAPSRGRDDARYRELAAAYMDFEPIRRMELRDDEEVHCSSNLEGLATIDGAPIQFFNQSHESSNLICGSHMMSNEDASYRLTGSQQPSIPHKRYLTRSMIAKSSVIQSPQASFSSITDNLNSPELRSRALIPFESYECGRAMRSPMSKQQKSWQSPPAVVQDSQSTYNRALPGFTSPGRVLEVYLGNCERLDIGPKLNRPLRSSQQQDDYRTRRRASSSSPLSSPAALLGEQQQIFEEPEEMARDFSPARLEKEVAYPGLQVPSSFRIQEGSSLSSSMRSDQNSMDITHISSTPQPQRRQITSPPPSSPILQSRKRKANFEPQSQPVDGSSSSAHVPLSNPSDRRTSSPPRNSDRRQTTSPPPSSPIQTQLRKGKAQCGPPPAPPAAPLKPPPASPTTTPTTTFAAPPHPLSGQFSTTSSFASIDCPPKSTSRPISLQSTTTATTTHSSSRPHTSLTSHPPPPPTSTHTLPPLLTPPLLELDQSLSLKTRYRPVFQARELRPMERGYWNVVITVGPGEGGGIGWDEAFIEKAWGFLELFVRRGRAGWGVWCLREREGAGAGAGTSNNNHNHNHNDGTANGNGERRRGNAAAMGCNSARLRDNHEYGNGNRNTPGNERDSAQRETWRVYCWGSTVGHIFLLLLLASQRRVRGLGAQWIDGSGEVVIKMSDRTSGSN